MSKVLVTESSLAGIAAAIRAKNGTQNTYQPGQMAAAIAAIPTGTTPTGTVNITQNGTVDVTDYASADVAVPNSYAAADEGKVVSNGALVAQTARASEITANGTYDTTLNDEVTVNVSGGGGGDVPLLTQAQWVALSGQQKRAYGLVAIQDANSGFDRGELVYGADYIGDILQSGTAASSASVNVSVTGSYKLIIIALNSEASTRDLTLSVALNNAAITGETLAYNDYHGSGNDRRNYRVNAYDIEVESGDTIAIELANRGNYASFIYAIVDANITEIVQRRSTADAACSGSYTNDAIVLQGTFNSSNGGTVNLQGYTANTTIQTDNPGSNYKSAYIFWCA